MYMPPKKKVKRKKSGVLQKQKQTQIVTVNIAIPPRKRRRTKKPASGAGAGAGAPPPPPPSRQQFVQTIYPTTNPFQQDMHFNLSSISAQLKNLQNKSVGGISLGSVSTQQQIQLGNPEVEPIRDLPIKTVEDPIKTVEESLTTPKKQRGPYTKATDIQKEERREIRELIRQKSLTTPIIGRPVPDVGKLFTPGNTYESIDELFGLELIDE